MNNASNPSLSFCLFFTSPFSFGTATDACPDNVIEITELLYDHLTLYAHSIHFTSIHRTIKRLEETLETLQEEVLQVFDDMKDRGLDDVLAFFIVQQRWEWSVSQSPYVQRRPLDSGLIHLTHNNDVYTDHRLPFHRHPEQDRILLM
jgi:hypothetical protein